MKQKGPLTWRIALADWLQRFDYGMLVARPEREKMSGRCWFLSAETEIQVRGARVLCWREGRTLSCAVGSLRRCQLELLSVKSDLNSLL